MVKDDRGVLQREMDERGQGKVDIEERERRLKGCVLGKLGESQTGQNGKVDVDV